MWSGLEIKGAIGNCRLSNQRACGRGTRRFADGRFAEFLDIRSGGVYSRSLEILWVGVRWDAERINREGGVGK